MTQTIVKQQTPEQLLYQALKAEIERLKLGWNTPNNLGLCYFEPVDQINLNDWKFLDKDFQGKQGKNCILLCFGEVDFYTYCLSFEDALKTFQAVSKLEQVSDIYEDLEPALQLTKWEE